ncbi:hypothetical protein PR048_015516 [Dryococelus australis]|uniref:Uncharacterized protein n=1 Tax=Dryococelus australis TaxID=614101 RepID=A0ABQ9HH44_9NEOP|nr:hypothetical protein PR048_015516 [Dryococelus australis]
MGAKNASVMFVCQKLSGGQFSVGILKIRCKFVSGACRKIIELIKVLEGGHYPLAHLLWDELMHLSSELKRHADGGLPSQTQQMLHEIKNDEVKESIKSAISSCCVKSCTKLASYIAPSPANSFYTTAGELFNLAKAGQQVEINCNKLLASKTKLPPFAKVSNDDLFVDLYFHEQLKGHVHEGSKIDLPQLLSAVSIAKPEFKAAALKTIWAPVSGVDAERCLSSYNVVLNYRRTRLKEENIEMCNMLKFNV